MSISGKKSMALFLVFCLAVLSGNLTAQQGRKGIKLSIEQNDGNILIGELISVKKDSLLLLDEESQADLSLPVSAVKIIKVHNKHRMLELGLLGVLGGAAVEGLKGTEIVDDDQAHWEENPVTQSRIGFLGYAAIAGGAGVLIGAVIGIDKKMDFQGKSDAEIQQYLEKLSKKARVRGLQQ